ncbi:hypothetical protein AOLI_G00302460 [Acnodon oligacanthus]
MGGKSFAATLLFLGCISSVDADSLSAPLNVTIKTLEGNSAVVTWEILEGDPVIGFAITQQKKDVRMMRFIQEVNTTTRSCALWDLEADTEYIVHVQSISMSGTSPPSDPVLFRTPKESEKLASKSPDEVTMKEVGQAAQLRAGELIIIVVVLIMWAGVIALFCRQYDIIKDNEPNNNKDKAKNSSECSTPEHPTGGLLRSKDTETTSHLSTSNERSGHEKWNVPDCGAKYSLGFGSKLGDGTTRAAASAGGPSMLKAGKPGALYHLRGMPLPPVSPHTDKAECVIPLEADAK